MIDNEALKQLSAELRFRSLVAALEPLARTDRWVAIRLAALGVVAWTDLDDDEVFERIGEFDTYVSKLDTDLELG